jgi:hypothetical protein
MMHLDVHKYNTFAAALQTSRSSVFALRASRAADCIVTVRVKRDELIGNVYLEDSREFKESALGHGILHDNVLAELKKV